MPGLDEMLDMPEEESCKICGRNLQVLQDEEGLMLADVGTIRSSCGCSKWEFKLHLVGLIELLNKPACFIRCPMSEEKKPIAVLAENAPARAKLSAYPEPFASRMAGREKRPLGDIFGLTNFGVNLTRLAPSAMSSLRHTHSKQDEFIYILQGRPTLRTDEGSTQLAPGMCAGFKAGSGNGHHLINETGEEVVYLEIGDRTSGDEGSYPDDDLKALLIAGHWTFVHKDGTPYD